MRILYVEDNLELRETIALLMEDCGCSVVSCSSAEEALELDARDRFDVLVADANLPGLSGTELARKVLAADPQRCVLLCSGHDLGDYPSSWGPHVHTLRKPFELEALEALLEVLSLTLQAGRRQGA
jgi:two-component system cell cycle response regulator CpdR